MLRLASQASLSSLHLPLCFKRGVFTGMKLKPSAPGATYTVHWAARNPENPGKIRQLFHQRYGETDWVLNTYASAWPWPVFRGKRPEISMGNSPAWQGQSIQRKKKIIKKRAKRLKLQDIPHTSTVLSVAKNTTTFVSRAEYCFCFSTRWGLVEPFTNNRSAL